MRAGRQLAEPLVGPRVDSICVIVNEQAGGVRRRPGLAGRLARVVGGAGLVIPTRSLEEVVRAVGRARAEGVDTIAICGGDGTNVHTLTAVARAFRGRPWPRLALLAGGTVNSVAHNFGAAGNAERQLSALLESEEPRVRRRPLLQVNERVGFMFGTHFVARVLDAYYAGRTGPLGSAVLAARIVASAATGGEFARSLMAPEEVSLEIDGRDFGARAVTGLMACVVAAPAVVIRATRRAGEDGGFHLVATTAPPTVIAREAGRLWTGLAVAAMDVDEVAHRATLAFARGTRYTIDGDLFDGDRIELAATAPVDVLLPERP